MADTILVMLVEDNRLFREMLAESLAAYPEIQIVAEASDGREALALMREHAPDVAVLDLAMPGLSGLDTIEMVRREFPGVHVLVHSMHHDPVSVNQSLRAGASGFVPKTAPVDELVEAIRVVHRGSLQFSPSALEKPPGE